MQIRSKERVTRIKRISHNTIRNTSRNTSRAARFAAKRAWRDSSHVWRFGRSFVRDYTALSIVTVGAILVSLLNLRIDAADDSFIARVFGGGDARYVQTALTQQVSRNLALAPVPLVSVRETGRKEERGVIIDDLVANSLAYTSSYGVDTAIEESDEDIKIYTVKRGDTIGTIAQRNNVTIDTLLWANEIDDVSRIKPGDTIIILATNGVQHKVIKGDTIESIAKKYKGSKDAIISYNGLLANGALTVGNEIVIPDGIREEIVRPQPVVQRRTYTSIGVARQVAVSKSYFSAPVRSYRRTQGLHRTNAVDLAAPSGTPVYAAAAGKVIIARYGWNGGYGNYVVIQHSNGTKTLYAHHRKLYVKVGEKVKRGEQIAAMGSTGRSTGPHVHFEVRGARNPF